MKATIEAWIAAHKQELEQTYKQLHANAELSWQEKETTAFLRQQLTLMNVDNRIFEQHTGVVAEWPVAPNSARSPGPVVALRADIDALWQNVGNEWKANHSCGHDGHMTVVLFALRCLKEIGYRPAGKLIAIFQPAEETGGGALKMLELGLLEEVDYLLGIHLRPIKELRHRQASSAIYHGATVFLEGKLMGRQSHASRPNEGINVIDAMAAIVNAVNAVKIDPMKPASCKVTKLIVGNQNINIIPDSAEFAIDVRAQTNESMDELLEMIEHAVKAAGTSNGTLLELNVKARMVAAIPNAYMERVVGEAITDVLGDSGLAEPPVTPGGEDFHFYPLLKPSLQATMVGLGSDLEPGLHHPQMTFNLEALQVGVAILALSIVKLFESTHGS